MTARGFVYQPLKYRSTRCGSALKNGAYNTQYNWHASGHPIVYPFVDEASTAPISTNRDSDASASAVRPPAVTQSAPGVRCGASRHGKLAKPGRLASNSVYHYSATQHADPTQFIFVAGRNFGQTVTALPPPDPAPDEEKVVPKKKRQLAPKVREPEKSAEGKGFLGAVSSEDDFIPLPSGDEVQLHKSAVSTKITPVAVAESDDIIELPSRDEEIDLHRSAVSTNISIADLSDGLFTSTERSVEEPTSPQEVALHVSVQRLDLKINNESDAASEADSPAVIIETPLQKSHSALNLSLKERDKKLKREKILERLKLINAELQVQDGEPAPERPHMVRVSGEELVEAPFVYIKGNGSADNTDGDQVRECDTCKNSLDRLVCTHPENARKSFQIWCERDKSTVEHAVEAVANSLNSPAGSEDSSTTTLQL